MGGLVIETVRPGVQFIPDAAAAFRRADAQVRAEFGRGIDVNSTHRDWDQQLRMYNAWQAYISGRGPYPGHSKALHPADPLAFHTKGLALDSDDWRIPRIVQILAENGFIRNRLYVPNENHHFEWLRNRDQNHGKPIGGGAASGPHVPKEDDDMLMLNLHGIGTATHKVALGPGIFRHFISTDPFEKIKNVARIQDDWQDVSYVELPALLRTYGCDLNIWDWNPSAGGFCILDPLTGTVKPGNAWTASGATRAAIAGIKLPTLDPAPIVAAVRDALAKGIELDEKAIAKAVNDDAARRLAS